ncbi:carbonic anhydrase [Basidiobolus meristosporus CBS 931.73]|uniref:Carbonic anhydrase n=1 Tax=Basidiobolus meristosporus CBS 931.73 TaxID=1314790 RepID=A0A1Y1XY36_9FUNG|nr:carbonic anhydrase [Basidiobolus meristosporus CBS 931.73]|eukprot:ORX90667.1 carbonic anhydrase [Basidiobolus meristosporus CBS 931.73]
MKSIILNILFVWSSIASAQRQINWEYGGISGPQRWGDLSSEYAACKTGHYQSPIDITRASAKLIKSTPLKLRWPKGKLANVTMINNGHTLQVNIPSKHELQLKRDGVKYYMRQFHIHTPSEHHINGRYYDAEIHIVMSDKKNKKNHVLGILMALSDDPNPFLQELCAGKKLPSSKGESAIVQHLSLHDLFVSTGGFETYFAYEGSLTTPPCTEGVRWILAQKPVPITWRQLDELREIIRYNARYVQTSQ